MIFKYPNFDNFVFLLSVDWAKPFVKLLLSINSDESDQVLEAAKMAVRDMMGSDSSPCTYYEISFDEERKQGTEKILLNGIGDNLRKKVIDFVVELESGFSQEENQQMSIIWAMLLQLESYESLFGEKDCAKMESLIHSLDSRGDEFFEDLDEGSNSEWDSYIRNIKPGTESHVSDFFVIHIYDKKIFSIFLGYVEQHFSESQVNEIKETLSLNYTELTGANLSEKVFSG